MLEYVQTEEEGVRQLIDNRLRANIQDTFPSRCTISTPNTTTSSANQEVPDGTYSAVAGLSNIYCRIGPLIEIRPTDSEVRTSKAVILRRIRQCVLLGDYPTITPDVHFAIVDGLAYPIVGIDGDGSSLATRLRLEIVSP